jgi:cytochrome c2
VIQDSGRRQASRAGWLTRKETARSPAALIAWYGLSAFAVYAIPAVVRLKDVPWNLPAGSELQTWIWAGTFLLCATGIQVARSTRDLLVLPVPWLLAFVLLRMRPDIPVSRSVALLSFALALALLAIPLLWPRLTRVLAIAGTTLGAGVVAIAVARVGRGERAPQLPLTVRRFESAVAPLRVSTQDIAVKSAVRGGALAAIDSSYLLVTGEGSWYQLDWNRGAQQFESRQLPIPAPMTRPETPVGIGALRPLIRVSSMILDTSSEMRTVHVAHEVWDAAGACLAMRVSMLTLSRDLRPVDSTWTPLYTTSPCLKPVQGLDPVETGGRLIRKADGSLLLTVGDYGLNQRIDSALAQGMDNDYGKILQINPDGTRSIVSSGHRNPGGLTVDRAGRIWETEHGPRGGDELNLITTGGNYGWPLITNGTEYGTFTWRAAAPDSNRGFVNPVWSLVPSVGISSIIAVRGVRFSAWSGDLLAGSLRARQLIRFRLTGDRLVYIEPISVDHRIRDLVEGADGRIVLWTDGGQIVWLDLADELVSGASEYGACADCHGLGREGVPGRGPNIIDIAGRNIASADYEYSEALRAVRGRWSRERLDAFLADPDAFARGTSMQFPGIADSARRNTLLEYLIR